MVDVAVVGNINMDLVLNVGRHPVPGETVMATGRAELPGGKGANQAVAAARLGSATAIVGRVGADAHGDLMEKGLRAAGVDTAHVTRDETVATGLAVVTVDETGENSIVVAGGANSCVSADDVERARDMLQTAAVVLVQLEIPQAALDAALAIATGTVVLNPAPFRALPQTTLERVDVLVPNRTELAHLAGGEPPASVEDATAMAAGLGFHGALVVTLGADGAVVVADGSSSHVPAPEVTPVDTTGAGDAFCGALADGLVRGRDLPGAVAFAVKAAAVAVTKPGAQPSMPTRAEVGDG